MVRTFQEVFTADYSYHRTRSPELSIIPLFISRGSHVYVRPEEVRGWAQACTGTMWKRQWVAGVLAEERHSRVADGTARLPRLLAATTNPPSLRENLASRSHHRPSMPPTPRLLSSALLFSTPLKSRSSSFLPRHPAFRYRYRMASTAAAVRPTSLRPNENSNLTHPSRSLASRMRPSSAPKPSSTASGSTPRAAP